MKKLTKEQFMQKVTYIHGDIYDYSLVTYIDSKVKVKIICPIHGEFEQTPYNHFLGKGCPLCGNAKISNIKTKNTIYAIEKFSKKHKNRYDYSLVEYKDCHSKIKIICSIHGIFEQTAHNHQQGQGCPKCNTSKGELVIEQWLKDHNIIFESQKKFDNCRNKKPLPFDFYLPEHNCCIEFDGEQHYKISRRSKDIIRNTLMFEQTKLHDKIKDEYCRDNNIRLIRIPYYEYKNIDIMLKTTLLFKIPVKQFHNLSKICDHC